ncbi:MAG: hypothetical protein A3H23_02895 [Planctomycetes bacterium RIFCSPLOWO2_12_FULL_40_19]|nr:MAG: hypothetical protein A3H23_02895 [Planctomycetes bacterium RIFCSPLOWO2_12_FULL_40_19]
MTLSPKIHIDLGENEFKVIGPQLNSAELVELKIRYRGDDGPARFTFRDEHINAHIDNITDAEERGLTTIGNHKIKIRQIEHVLSALVGMSCLSSDLELSYLNKEITDKIISPPVCHINTEEYVLGIKRSFRKKECDYIEIGHPIIIKEDNPADTKDASFAIFTPLKSLHVTVSINFPHFWGRQKFSCNLSKYGVYEQQIAWARSFFATPYPHKQEWEKLKKKFPALINERIKHAQSIMIDYTQDKWITTLYSEDEPVRHKLLDFLGDLALIGFPLHAGIFVYKPHHKFNRQCIRTVVDALK